MVTRGGREGRKEGRAPLHSVLRAICSATGMLLQLLGQTLSAQQLQWQVPPPGLPSTTQFHSMAPFCDFDGDGGRDFIQVVNPNPLLSPQGAVQIVSGRGGTVLWSSPQWQAWQILHAGDVDGDGYPEVAILKQNGLRWVEIVSTRNNTVLWQQFGTIGSNFGDVMLGNIDVNADGRSDFLAATNYPTNSDVFVYDSSGAILYVVPCYSQGRVVYSLCNMGDMNGDGRHDFLMGCTEPTGRGVLVMVSGANGATLRLSYGVNPGDYMIDHATNLGDIDGDGVNDYMGFPFIFSFTGRFVQFSGATGNVIRTGFDYADSVIAGHDMDLDGVPDLVMGSDGQVAPNVYGLTRAISGRDGTELWRVENFQPPPGSGYSNGGSGWARFAAGLGAQPGQQYPTIAWMDLEYCTQITHYGRVRSYNTERAGQGAISGHPCSSNGRTAPQIGARQTSSGARITIAKGPPGALALLNLGLVPQTHYMGIPLPIDLGWLGMPGCKAYVGPDVHYLRAMGNTGIDKGYAAVDLPFQLSPAGLGTPLVAQWLVFDPASLGYATTAMHALRGQ